MVAICSLIFLRILMIFCEEIFSSCIVSVSYKLLFFLLFSLVSVFHMRHYPQISGDPYLCASFLLFWPRCMAWGNLSSLIRNWTSVCSFLSGALSWLEAPCLWMGLVAMVCPVRQSGHVSIFRTFLLGWCELPEEFPLIFFLKCLYPVSSSWWGRQRKVSQIPS